MIRRVSTLQNFGIYKDYKWGNVKGIQDFNDKNIIYGWNYSGKTTLSRLFMCLKEKKILEDFKESNFTLLFENIGVITGENLHKHDYNIAIFNKDYIESRLTWNTNKLGEPIAFDVGDGGIIREEIEKLQEKKIKVLKRKDNHNQAIENFEEFDNNKFTTVSKSIRLQVYSNTVNYDKADFKKKLRNIHRDAYVNFILNNNQVTELNLASNSIDNYEILEEYIHKFNFKVLCEEVKKLLETQPNKETIISILDKNNDLSRWVKEGLTFDENKETCSFCGKKVEYERIDLLTSYFSNQSQKLRVEIEDCIKRIDYEKARTSINKYLKNEIVPNLADKYFQNYTLLEKELQNYIKKLDFLKDQLQNKIDSNLFNNVTIFLPKNNTISLYRQLIKLNSIIREHNNFKINFVIERDKSRDKLCKHLISDFLKNENYFEKEEAYQKAIKWQLIYDKLLTSYDKIIREKESSLKTISKGRKKLENFIQKFLNREDIEIIVTSDDKFNLMRNNKFARNLSEGEKMAIAFSYFLVEFESQGINKMRNSIVFIDDPISSLDSNHISQIYSLINSFFFRKGVEENKPESVINCFKQLFISTHNFEFFSFLRDSYHLKKKKKIKKDDENVEVNSCNYYQIRRLGNDNSIIAPLPKALGKFKSEYIYLFSIIKEYKDKLDKYGESYDILIPNAIRRFLEIYTLMKIPSEPDSLENRITELVSDVNNFKTLNHFSHFTTFDKLTKHDELMMILPEACNELFNLLKIDNTHYCSLLKAIK